MSTEITIKTSVSTEVEKTLSLPSYRKTKTGLFYFRVISAERVLEIHTNYGVAIKETKTIPSLFWDALETTEDEFNQTFETVLAQLQEMKTETL